MNPSAREAQELDKLIPNPWIDGHYYDVEFAGRKIKIARKRGRGKQASRSFLHVIKPCKTVLKSPDGEVLDRYDDFAHYSIRLHDPDASWKAH